MQQSIWELTVTLHYLIYKEIFNLIHKQEKNQLCLFSYHEHKEKDHQHEYDIHLQTNTAPAWPNAELQ